MSELRNDDARDQQLSRAPVDDSATCHKCGTTEVVFYGRRTSDTVADGHSGAEFTAFALCAPCLRERN